MKKHPLLRTALLVMTAAALLCVSALAVEDGAPANSMYGTFWALVPPVIAITLALITKEAYSSLFIGVTVGALFSQGFSPIGALNMRLRKWTLPIWIGRHRLGYFLCIQQDLVSVMGRPGPVARCWRDRSADKGM